MKTARLKHTFTSGEVSPLLDGRKDFSRYNNGCHRLKNMVVHTQGPISIRSGYEFIYNLSTLDLNVIPEFKLVEFIFNDNQAYLLIFYRNSGGDVTVVFAENDGLIVHPTSLLECPPGDLGVAVTQGDVVSLDLPAAWDIESMDFAQSGDEIYFAMETLTPHIIRRHTPYCWVLEEQVFTDIPPEWASGGFPSSVTFHQQRLVYAGSAVNRQSVWCTKAGDFSSFETNSPLLDSDAITFTLDSGTQNKIHWMQSGKSLNIGTIGNEWTVVGATRTALTPTNILAQRQTNLGSVKIKPIMVNNNVLFVGRYGKTVEEFVYNFNTDSYVTSDMSILSDHLTNDWSITGWTYQQSPDKIIWSIREDGDLLGITYQREHEVIAWHQHDTVGKFLHVASLPGTSREDELWAICERSVYNQNGTFIEHVYTLEKKALIYNSTNPHDGRFLDCHTHLDPLSPVNTLTGLSHLRGQFVTVYADGDVLTKLKVADDGTLDLGSDYEDITVGLPYVAEVWPTLAEVPNTDGASHGKTSRVSELLIDVKDTLGGEIGKIDPETGEETNVEFLDTIPKNYELAQPFPLYTGIIRASLGLTSDRNEQYFIRQTQPLPLTIRAITDIVEITE